MVRAAGITKVRLEAIPIDGMLVGAVAPYVVVMSTTLPPTRKRYTLAHETGHVALGSRSNACFQGGRGRVGVERDADHFAAEALLPEDQMRAESTVLSIEDLEHIARRFRASVEAVGLRVVELGMWNVAFVCWRVLPRPGSSPKLRLAWGATPPGRRLYLPKYATPPPELVAQWEEVVPRSDTLRLSLGSLRGDYRVESVRRHDALLSVVYL